MVKTHLYLYDETKAINQMTDYGDYIEIADRMTDRLDEVMGTYRCRLLGLPKSKEFSPSTKFILIKEDAQGNNALELHLLVQQDLVEKPILSKDNYFNHDITFNEASVVAQSRICDNISNTYKLQDVNLDIAQQIDADASANKVQVIVDESTMQDYPTERAGYSVAHPSYTYGNYTDEIYITKRKFMVEFASAQDETAFNAIKLLTDCPSGQTRTISIPIPNIVCYQQSFESGEYVRQGNCSVVVTIKKVPYSATSFENAEVTEHIINPSTAEAWAPDYMFNAIKTDMDMSDSDINTAFKGIVFQTIDYRAYGSIVPIQKVIRLKRLAEYGGNTSRTIDLEVSTDYKYQVSIGVYNFENANPQFTGVHYDTTKYMFSSDIQNCRYCNKKGLRTWRIRGDNFNQILINDQYGSISKEAPMQRIEFGTYDANTMGKILYWSAPKTNAYQLFIKSIFASQFRQKTYEEWDLPYYKIGLPFYVDDNWKTVLESTETIENFYNQKNLWEMFLEIGKYIHCIPIIKFGTNGRFLVDWRKLGDTKRGASVSTPKSIYNSRQIENYICSCQSYISNYVQLGGEIEEYLVPKSSSEDYLVYNDVAEIITSKPIQEIIDMSITCIKDNAGVLTGSTKSLVRDTVHGTNGYIFEKSIYQLLEEEDVAVSKGLALYYELGTNKIQGLNYQLPKKTVGNITTTYQYTIKRIIKKLWGLSTNQESQVQVNCFAFKIRYRTLDDVRVSQVRPDLRKYLLNTPLDLYPRHDQFCNQQDLLIDSEKFGNNVYGKLIRTGNTEYKKTEWVDSIENAKKVGELYVLDDGNLYYVSSVSHTFFENHIDSLVEFSKDFNRLSEVIGIPSEPRFYEISERNTIKREINIQKFVCVSTSNNLSQNPSTLDRLAVDYVLLDKILFNNEDYPNYAISIFKNDQNDTSDSTIVNNNLFFRDVMNVVNTTTSKGTLTFSWDMKDNFSAGDQVEPTNYSLDSIRAHDTAFYKLKPYQYPDPHGRAQLFDFMLVKQDFSNINSKYIQRLPADIYDLRRVKRTSMYSFANSVDTAVVFNHIPTDSELNDVVDSHSASADGKGMVIRVEQNGNVDYYTAYYSLLSSEWKLILWQNIEEYDRINRDLLDALIASDKVPINTLSNKTGYVLLKDNREALSFNLNIQAVADSDRFVISGKLWSNKKEDLVLAFLSEEVNKINADTIDGNTIIKTTSITRSATLDDWHFYPSYIQININSAIGNQISAQGGVPVVTIDGEAQEVKALALVYKTKLATTLNLRNFVIARNITDLIQPIYDQQGNITGYDLSEITKDWYMRDLFEYELRGNATEE